MTRPSERSTAPPFEQWISLARQVVRSSLRLGWNDIFDIYSYPPTIPLAEALALEARRVGSDTHITLMTDDLWFTSMKELPVKWLSAPSPVHYAIDSISTAGIYLGGPADARRMKDIPPDKFAANEMGGTRQHEPRRRRKVRHVDLPIGQVTQERAEAYGLDYEAWYRSYQAALAVDLKEIARRGATLARSLSARRKVHLTSDAGTDLGFETKGIAPVVDDGIISAADVRRGFVETALPAGKVEFAVRPESVEGEIHSTDPLFYAGRTVVRPWYRIRRGRIIAWGADERGELLGYILRESKVARARVGYMTVGLNPAVEPIMLRNEIVHDDVGFGLGPHPQLEHGSAEPEIEFYATMGPARREILR